MKAMLAAIALSGAVLTIPAYAFQCPADMAKIDAALKAGPDLGAKEMAEVKKLRVEGERLHKAGQHGKSIKTLGKAMEILDIK